MVATDEFGTLFARLSEGVAPENLYVIAGAARTKSAAPLRELLRTIDDTKLSDVPGVVPTGIVTGDVTKLIDASRPVVNRMRELEMPEKGATFGRPRATVLSLAELQDAEFDVLESQGATITGDTVTKRTHGSGVRLSDQAVNWAQPEGVRVIGEDLGDAYAIDTEATATGALETGATNTTPADLASLDGFVAGVVAGAATVYNNAHRVADTLFLSVDEFYATASLTDDVGRPALFATFREYGITPVMSPGFSAGTRIVAASSLCERFEIDKGLAVVAEPARLGVLIVYRGYFATNVRPEGLCAVTDDES